MILVWLKISEIKNQISSQDCDNFVLAHLNYWLGVFADKSKYKIIIYNENFNLPESYSCYEIMTRKDIMSDISYNKFITEYNNKLAHRWRNTCSAMIAPYFIFKDYKMVWNIDAIDMLVLGDIRNNILKIENYFSENQLFTFSADLHLSYGMLPSFRKHHFCFGVNLSSIKKMKKILMNQMNAKLDIPSSPYGTNVDLITDIYLENYQVEKPICFLTKDYFIHERFEYQQYMRAIDKENIEHTFNKKTTIVKKHPRTVIF